jgi:IS605 OrfB family transposase
MKKYWKRSVRNIHSWAFYDLELKISYKGNLVGVKVEFANSYKTSQECNSCGKIIKNAA